MQKAPNAYLPDPGTMYDSTLGSRMARVTVLLGSTGYPS